MHQCLFWGCLLAVAITFPLVFGWIHFRTLPGDQMTYVTYLFGFPDGFVPPAHGDRLAALSRPGHLGGAGAGRHRALALAPHDATRARARCSSSAMDFLPLILLFAISVTGLALTVSQEWLRGSAYSFLAILHAITVIAALLFLPFGKFFHIFQRPAQLGVKLYQDAGARGPRRALRALRRALRLADAHRRPARRAAASSASTTPRPARPATGRRLCPACKRKSLSTRATANQGGSLVAKTAAFTGRADQPLRPSSELHSARRLAGRIAASAPRSW